MQTANRHIIQKQFLEVEMKHPPDAFAFRNRLQELFYEKLLPQLEAAFDAACPATRYIKAEQLLVDVGELPVDNWEEELISRSMAKVKQLLNAFSIDQSKTNLVNSTREESERQKTKATEADWLEAFYFFLRHSYLPWNYQPENREWLEDGLNKRLQEDADGFLKSLMVFLQTTEKHAWQRLVYHLPEAILLRLLRLASIHFLPAAATGLIEHVRKVMETVAARHLVPFYHIKSILFFPIFTFLASGRSSSSFEIFFWEAFYHELRLRVQESDALEQVLWMLKKEGIDPEPVNVNLLPNTAAKEKDVSTSSRIKATENEEIYIQNAGLVLLHPFLLTFFENLLLLNEQKQFIDEEHACRALQLLAFLATGIEAVPEYDLVLNKILCGLPADMPVRTEMKLLPSEKEEARALLLHVIQLWKMNQVQVNTTPESLQAAFLQRAGKLTKADTGWLLQVESSSYDIVLSSLPWGISIIKNELMSEMLWVEWV